MTAVRSLLIGASYVNHPRLMLRGCANDVCGMALALEGAGGEMSMLADGAPQGGWQAMPVWLREAMRGPPTREAVLAEVEALAAWAAAQPGPSHVWFYFSGHGGQTRDQNGDEMDGQDEYILASDCQPIRDDELKSRLVEALPARCTLMAVIDACHSGTMLDLRNRYRPEPDPLRIHFLHPRIDAQVFLLSSSRHNQTSVEVRERNRWGGALTLALRPLLAAQRSVALAGAPPLPLPFCGPLMGRLAAEMRQRQQPQRPQLNSTARLEDRTAVPLWPLAAAILDR